MHKDEFGVGLMLAIIELSGPRPPPTDLVEEMLFGRSIGHASLHPQIRDIYAGSFRCGWRRWTR
jgi:hypothetical protein